MLLRLAIAALGAAAIIGVLVAALAWLSYRDPGSTGISDVDHTAVFTSWLQRRRPRPAGFEVVDRGVIVPVGEAPALFRACSRSSIDPIDGYWRPPASLIRDIEARLPAMLNESALDPLDSYARQYAGVVSGGRQIVYGSFVSSQHAGGWQREVVTLCGGGRAAFGIEFDVATQTFGEPQVDALF